MIKFKVSRVFGVVTLLFVGFTVFVGLAEAASTGTVTATVTAIIYSVSLDNADVAFGTVAVDSTKDTTNSGVDDSTTASNDGSVAAKLNIKAGDSTNWTLAGTADSETYTMDFCNSDCDGSPSWTDVGIDPSYATLTASLAVGSTLPFDLQIGTPTSTTQTGEQTVTVTVQAAAP